MNYLTPIEQGGQRVVTTMQLAEAYGTDTKNINDNFANNKDRYKLEKHYFVLDGEALKGFKEAYPNISGNLKYAPTIYLWTEKGAWLHAKSLNTDQAWEAYETLVDDYYRAVEFIKRQLGDSRKISSWHRTAIGYIQVAREFSRASGVRIERAMAVALAKAELETGKGLVEFKRLLPAIPEENAEVLAASQIGEQFGLKASATNLLLEEMKLQFGIREAGKKPGTERLVKKNPWKLTEEGKKHGIMQDAAKQTAKGGKWEGFQILWKPTTVDLVRDYLAQKAAEERSDNADG